MAAAVFRIKFTVPSPSARHLARPRLDRIWDDADGSRLVTVIASAGWGKTEFLAARARAVGRRALWYTLDELDRDPSVLAAHLLAACGLPPSSAPPLEQLAAIVGGLDGRSLLVLDDVHAIAGATAAREFLSRLLRYLPPGCALALGARVPVDLSAARLDSRGRSAHLSAVDLALTPEENQAILRDRLGDATAASLAPRIQALTGGWPIGLEIVCQALADGDSQHRLDALARLEAGEGRWFDLFAAEILADLDEATRDFLVRTSVLSHLEPELCDRLLDARDSGARLADLARRDLFTKPVGEGAWRYHNLLRRCLRRRLAEELTANDARRLHRRAARLLADRGEPEAAALDLIRAGDDGGAAAVLAPRAHELADTRRPETLGLVLADLPENTIRGDARLLLIRAGLAQLQGDWRQAEEDLRRGLRQDPSVRIEGAIRARLVRLQLQRGRFRSCLETGRRALARRPAPGGADRGVILSSIGVAAASLGRMKQGEEHLRQALASARRRRDHGLEGRCLFLIAANIHFVRGDLDQALRDAGRARDIFRELGRLDLACHAEGVLGFVLAGCGRLAEARESSLWALQRAETIGYRLIAGYARLTLGMCELVGGDPEASAARFREAIGVARELGEQALETWARLGLAEAAWRRRDVLEAETEATRASVLATQRDDIFCRARALAHLGRLAEARDPGTGSRAWDEADRLLRRLGAALERDRLRLWRSAATRDDPGPALSAIAAAGRGHLLEQLEAPLIASLRPAATIPVGTAGTVPLHVRLLGPLEIDRGDEALTVGAWKSRRARRLFNLLILNRSRALPREVIMETMWPEHDPQKAALNLRQSLFQLRRVLEPADGGEPRHILAEGETVRLDLGARGTCDRDRFEAALAAAQKARQVGDTAAEMDRLDTALSLWRGSVLADTPYDPEVDEVAATVRHRFLRAAERLLDLLAGGGCWEEVLGLAQSALAEDPFHEPFARHLVRSLLRLGHSSQAREAYARFESRLVRELDLLPSDRLKELVEGSAR